ncbi:MAG: carbohydrate binding domain-containing protein [Phycisphaerales bacterium]|nr:carbohydrate binding domain-containing protein [Planctomycetota bacterium]MCH8507699.1 carbohydrate binding domain-containing protein [Phycisphaerales bacterium]
MQNKLIGAAMIAAMATGALAGGTNLVTNGSFETPGPGFLLFQGWQNFGGGVFADASVEVPAQDGTTSVKMFGEFTGVQNDQVLIQTVPGISAGETYTLSAYAWHNDFDAVQPGNLVLLQMVFQNDSGGAIEAIEQVAIAPNSTPTNQWNLVELSGIAPPNTSQILVALLHLQLDGEATGATFWDNVKLIEGSTGGGCDNPADFNGDGVLNFFDIQAFLNAFQQGC